MADESDNTLKEGGIRLLPHREIALAKTVFDSTIEYGTAWIHLGSYLPFGLQNKNTTMTTNGELYFRDLFQDDFSQTTDDF